MSRATLTLPQALDRAVSAYNAGNFVLAEQLCQQIVAAKHDFFDAVHLLAIVQSKLGRIDEALASFHRALLVQPNNAQALNNRGITLKKLKRFDEALANYDRALKVRPDFAEALFNRGNALHELNRRNEALVSYDRALTVWPDYADALCNRGNTLKDLRRLDEALASYELGLAARADDVQALSGAAECAIRICDWDRRARFASGLNAGDPSKTSIISPFVLLSYSDNLALQLQCARNLIANQVPFPLKALWVGETWHHDKLRIAYLSADFYRHATAYLMAELFEKHDRSRFEVIGISFGVDDYSKMRKRLIASFDQFHDVSTKSDEKAAKLLHDLQVDIAIDLKGYTQNSRPGILAYRPAPIQVNYLGYPGTMGTEFIDYIITDKIVAPFEHQRFYAEKIVHLPDCYQVNDTKRKIPERIPTRQEMGLPEQGFVFCCFNNNWKITPQIFDVWMRLLHQVEHSVLWLYRDNADAERNLCKEALARAINPSRLVFAERLPFDEHLARYRLADLFLDTLPYNAHTTASDALWVGLPVLTCKGEAFAGRVASSLLNAVDLSEMATINLDQYEVQALKFARNTTLLAEIKAELARNRNTCALFNTVRFTRHIEAAYTTMWETWQRGELPKSFSVEPI
jgi:protein O-GlcNAc transferase